MTNLQRYKLRLDRLFTKTASIGKIAFVAELKEKATINPQFALITPRKNIDSYFEFISLRSSNFMKKHGILLGVVVYQLCLKKN